MRGVVRALVPVVVVWAVLFALHQGLAGWVAEGDSVTVALATGQGLIGVGLLLMVRLSLYLVVPPVAVYVASRAALRRSYSPAQRSSTPPS